MALIVTLAVPPSEIIAAATSTSDDRRSPSRSESTKSTASLPDRKGRTSSSVRCPWVWRVKIILQ